MIKVNFIHGDFNPCGGAERLSLVTMQALLEMGIEDITLTTLTKPDLSKLKNTYGKNLVSVMEKINKINVVNILEELRLQQQHQEHHKDYDYDITINTNGDAAPYYHSSFTKGNALTYCHFPSTKYHIECENIDYLKTDLGMRTIKESNCFSDNNNDYEYNTISNLQNCKSNLQFNNKQTRTKKECFDIIKYGYWNLMRNSRVITNSEFSRKTIVNAFGLDDVYILSPPIDIKTFRNVALMANGEDDKRKDIILVISRIDPHKKIENAIRLAKILKNMNIGRAMKIVGNLYYYYSHYYLELKQLVLDLDLTDYIIFEINASLDKLLSIMQESRVYFHPMVGEHFGIAVIEAMAAGLITVVPNEGGPSEFVPQKYHYNTIEHAAEIITHIFNQLPKAERIKISSDTNKFSTCNYIEGFKTILNQMLSKRRK